MQNQNGVLTRRTFIGGTAALAASSMVSDLAANAADTNPDSSFNGVQVGIIT